MVYRQELDKAKDNEDVLEQIRKAHGLERAAAERAHQKRLLGERKRAKEEMASKFQQVSDARADHPSEIAFLEWPTVASGK